MPAVKVKITAYSMNLQEVCDGLSYEQTKARHKQIDDAVWSARERALSAKSGRQSIIPHSDVVSLRSTYSRMSNYVDRNEDLESTIYENESNWNGTRSVCDSPNPYSEGHFVVTKHMIPVKNGLQKYNHVPKPKTLPDLDNQRGSFGNLVVGIDDPSMRSYSSINGIYMPKGNMCNRAKSANAATADKKTKLSWQCCDVLGPKVCRECALLKRRIFDSYKQDRPLSRLEVSERNFADSLTLSKALPEMSVEEIEDKIISGDVLRLSLKDRLRLKRQRHNLELRERSRTAPPLRSGHSSTSHVGIEFHNVTNTFFMNIRDLNNKIVTGKITNRLHNFQVNDDNYWKGDKNSGVKSQQQMALVPVEEKKPVDDDEGSQEKIIRSYSFYEPPLVPKICQNAEPAFYAGSDAGYKLPDRLPDKVLDGQIDDFTEFKPAWSRASSSTSHSDTVADT